MEPAHAEERPRTELQPPGNRAPWIVFALVVVAGIAVLLAIRYRNRGEPPPTAVSTAAPAPDAGVPEAAVSDAPVDPATDPVRARSLLDAISADPLYRKGAGEGELVRRWAVITDNLAEGVSPRKQLEFLTPSRPFAVVSRGAHTVIASESYQRYDAFADAVASVDVPMLMRAYRAFHGVLQAAYRALGYPGASLDAVSARALRRIVTAPVKDGDVVVERNGSLYSFADAKLEDLGAVEKHLLRMGPRNTRMIQAKAREILAQLAPAAAQGTGGAQNAAATAK